MTALFDPIWNTYDTASAANELQFVLFLFRAKATGKAKTKKHVRRDDVSYSTLYYMSRTKERQQ
jgi:hypothetical protein